MARRGTTTLKRVNLHRMTDVWGVGSVAYKALAMNVADHASDPSSLLLDLLVNDVSKFSVDKDGAVIGASFAGDGSALTNIGLSAFDTDIADMFALMNAVCLDSPAVTVTSDGATVTLSVEQNGGGDIRVVFSDGIYTWDCTPADTVSLSAGTDTTPTLNYVYVPQSTKTLTASTAGWPSEEHAPIATVLVQSATGVQTDGVYKMHAWTDHVASSDDQGHLAHINRWIRQQPASWAAGALCTATDGVNTLDIATTSGNVLQLHPHAFPAFDTATGSDVFVVNDPTTPYLKKGDLTGLIQDADGNTLGGAGSSHYNLVIWGVVSEDASDCKLMCNLPSGSYNNDVGGKATNDDDRTAIYDIPAEYIGTGFLIARLTVSISGTTYTVEQNEDLRGKVPGTAAGGGTGAGTVFDTIIVNTSMTRENETGVVGVSGGSTLSTGANILAYGQSHATLAGDMFLRTDTSSFLWRDHSASTTYHYGDATFDGGVLHVDSTNDRVGIGTTGPQEALHIDSASETTIKVETTAGSSYLRLTENNYLGGFLEYDADGNSVYLGVHNVDDTNLANDTRAVQLDRATGNARFYGVTSFDGQLSINDGVNGYIAIDNDTSDLVLKADPDAATAGSTIRFEIDGAATASVNPNFGFQGVGLYRGTTDSGLQLAGGDNSSNSGAGLILYGPSHTTAAYDILMRAGASNIYRWDHSANDHYWYDGADGDLQLVLNSDAALRPGTTDKLSLGSASYEWSHVYASAATITGDVACTTISASTSISGVTDWNSMTSPGNYQVNNGQANQPEAGYNWTVQVLRYSNANNVTQIASRMASTNPAIWVRTRAAATWSSWYCIFEATTFFIDETNNRVGILNTSPSVALHVTGETKTDPVTVASLPSAATVGAGTRAFVSDCTSTTFGSTAVGGGSTNIPVYSDGTKWLVG